MIRKIALDSFAKENKKEKNVDVIILIAAKNEEKVIGSVIKKIQQLNIKRSNKILVVNDGSTDNTEKIARENGCLVLNHFHNIGIGGATKTGYLAALVLNPEIIITIDADGQHNPSYVTEMIDKMDAGFALRPGSASTPLLTSTPYGFTWRTASTTLSGVSPPARMTRP